MPRPNQFNTRAEYLQWYREYRAKNAEKFREYNRIYNKEWRKKNGYAAEIRAKKKFPEKEAARRILQYTIKKGIMERGNCQICNKENAHGHHEDYTKPLEVMWFCPLHHSQYERKKISTDL